ncbi:hypothetical protein [Thermodesulfovibrio yellowstonii]|uniref:Cytochrome c oxidase subunit II n=1 Tax=Thermodesulfovibrio yellowstonii TaxID=28262 RepID=A0A9W6GH77_9BACT|nr:hypothetical protein [Thermodesulfovibrio islandicus]GLI53968.1 cytochrome c oxidase subunit II [Thermodesulfovibrio islandicus]
MIEMLVSVVNQIVDFFVKLFYICLLIAIFGFGLLNMLHQEVEKQRKMREGKEGRQ